MCMCVCIPAGVHVCVFWQECVCMCVYILACVYACILAGVFVCIQRVEENKLKNEKVSFFFLNLKCPVDFTSNLENRFSLLLSASNNDPKGVTRADTARGQTTKMATSRNRQTMTPVSVLNQS